MANLKTATLKNGLTIASLSAHPYTCSDGTTVPAQDKELVKQFTLKRLEKEIIQLKDMVVMDRSYFVSEEQLVSLRLLSASVDILIIPSLLRETLTLMRVRDVYPNCWVITSTEATRGLDNKEEKIIDVTKWSW